MNDLSYEAFLARYPFKFSIIVFEAAHRRRPLPAFFQYEISRMLTTPIKCRRVDGPHTTNYTAEIEARFGSNKSFFSERMRGAICPIDLRKNGFQEYLPVGTDT